LERLEGRRGSSARQRRASPPDAYYIDGHAPKALEASLNRYVVLYLATLVVLIPVDFWFLGMVAKGFFTAEVGDMLGEIRFAPASSI
jgi:hypothetical protein